MQHALFSFYQRKMKKSKKNILFP